MIQHLLTTTSEIEVERYLDRCAETHLRAFVHVKRVKDDSLHVQYNVYVFLPDNRNHE